ncbi:hypothetical protein O5165_25620, partial [Escherichia coli]|nr:hypothetical protein [Escherichia coli]
HDQREEQNSEMHQQHQLQVIDFGKFNLLDIRRHTMSNWLPTISIQLMFCCSIFSLKALRTKG